MGRPKILVPTVVAEKRCSDCDKVKLVKEFYHSKRNTRYKLSSHCRDCHNERIRIRRATDPKAAQASREARKRWRDQHKEEINAKRRAQRAMPGVSHAERLKYKYGLTPEVYAAMLAGQGGVCAICGTDKPKNNSDKFSVDHCHDTKQVRGLLCHNCNAGIGAFRDNPITLVCAINYLNRARPLKKVT